MWVDGVYPFFLDILVFQNMIKHNKYIRYVHNIYVYFQRYLKEARLCPSSGKYSNLFADDPNFDIPPSLSFQPFARHNQTPKDLLVNY